MAFCFGVTFVPRFGVEVISKYLAYIKKQMSEKELYKNYTMQELLDELDVIEAFENPGSALRVGEVTKKQSQLYDTLGVAAPTTL